MMAKRQKNKRSGCLKILPSIIVLGAVCLAWSAGSGKQTDVDDSYV